MGLVGPSDGAKGDDTVIIQLRSIGRAEPEDLFAGNGGQYAAYRGPDKLEGSNISVLTARHRDAYRRPSTHHDDHELATEARDAGFGAVVA
jgi:hypothetical protein